MSLFYAEQVIISQPDHEGTWINCIDHELELSILFVFLEMQAHFSEIVGRLLPRAHQLRAPAFSVSGSNIRVLEGPGDFYHELKTRIRTSRYRVHLASLYLGNGSMEQDLMNTLQHAMLDNSNLQVRIHVDCLRGTRGPLSSAEMLVPLIRKFHDRCHVQLYHTPDLYGWKKRIAPPRFNEGVGLSHIKVFVFDDDVILTGANLSTQYFVNRQDRYMVFENMKGLADYYVDLLETVGRLSFSLQEPQSLEHRTRRSYHSNEHYHLVAPPINPFKKPTYFKDDAYSQLMKFISCQHASTLTRVDENADTLIIPLLQIGNLSIRQDEEMIQYLLSWLQNQTEKWSVHVTSGYFNFTEAYKRLILQAEHPVRILTASPQANGFYGASGISKYIPDAYLSIERDFYQRVRNVAKQNMIQVQQYQRDGWTYHAKGLWFYQDKSTLPSITTIGSPNFGYRSSNRDLEAQVLLVTHQKSLQESLQSHLDSLYKWAAPVTESNYSSRPPKWVNTVTRMIQTML